MAYAPGEDEIKDAIESVLKTDMAATIAAVNTDRGVSGINAITAPASSAYAKTEMGYNIDRLGPPAVQITMSGDPEKPIELGDREAWMYTVRVAIRHVGGGESLAVCKKKLDMYRDVLNRILGDVSNRTLGGIAWECTVTNSSKDTDSRRGKPVPAGWAVAILEIWTHD